MKKIFIGMVAIVLLVGVASFIFIGKLDDLIADAIKKYGTEAIGTAVNVSSVKTNLTEGSILINGLNIANPAGYSQKLAFSMGEFSSKVDYENQEIAEIILRNPSINAELKGTENNFSDLLAGIPESADNAEGSSEDEPNITIQSLKILAAKVNLITDTIGDHSFVIDDYVINNISGTPSQIASKLTTQLTEHVSVQVKKFAQETIKKEAVKLAKEKATEKAKETANEIISDKIGDKIKGFNFKLN